MFTMALIGFASAIPAPLLGSTLTIRMAEANASTLLIGFAALFHLPQNFKFLWGPIIDHYRCPFFHRLGKRRGWATFSYLATIVSLIPLGLLDPNSSLLLFIFFSLSASLFSGCLYLTGVAYEIEALHPSQYAAGSACVIFGYRIGLLVSSAGALYLAAFGNWGIAYAIPAICLMLPLGALFLLPEPGNKTEKVPPTSAAQFFEPFLHLFRQPKFFALSLAIITYGIGDDIVYNMVGPFYLRVGLSKEEIALGAKILGLGVTLFGTFLAGWLPERWSRLSLLIVCGLIQTIYFALSPMLEHWGGDTTLFYFLVVIDHLSSGIMLTLFIAFLWRICRESTHGVSQYAFLWAIFGVKKQLFSALGGWWVELFGWHHFFLLVAALSLLSLFALRTIAMTLTDPLKPGMGTGTHAGTIVET